MHFPVIWENWHCSGVGAKTELVDERKGKGRGIEVGGHFSLSSEIPMGGNCNEGPCLLLSRLRTYSRLESQGWLRVPTSVEGGRAWTSPFGELRFRRTEEEERANLH